MNEVCWKGFPLLYPSRCAELSSFLGGGVGGVLAWWRTGVVAYWRSGVLVWWRTGVVAYWRGGVVAYWRGGVVAWWRTGVVAYWRGGVLASRKWLSNRSNTSTVTAHS